MHATIIMTDAGADTAIAAPSKSSCRPSCHCTLFSKASLCLISLPFFVAVIISQAVLTRRQYNTVPAQEWVLVGGLQSSSAVFKVRTPPAPGGDVQTNRTLLISTSPDQNDSAIVYRHQLPGTEPIETVQVEGLTNNTQYFYFIADNSSSDESDADQRYKGKFRTPQPEGTRFNFKVATAGCATTGTKASVFRHIADDDPLLFLHLGDFHYGDLNVDNVTRRITEIDKVMGSKPQAELWSSVGFTVMWDDHDWLGDESRGEGIGREAALESYRLAFPYHGPLPASLNDAYSGQKELPPYHAFTIGTVRFIISDLRSESSDKHIYSEEQKQWLFQEIAGASSFDFVVWVTPSPWIGPYKKDDTWWGHPEDRSELSDFITSTIGGTGGPKNLIAISSDAHMLGFDDGSNSYYGTAKENGTSPSEIFSFPVLQSGPMDRLGSAKGGPYSDGCNTMRMQRNHQYSTLDFQFEDGEEAEACMEVKSFRVMSSSSEPSTKEEVFSKRMCGSTFSSIETAGVGGCESTLMTSGNQAIVVIAGVLGLIGIFFSFCLGLGICEATTISVVVILSYIITYGLGIGIPFLMGAYGNFDIAPAAAISLAQMFTVCAYLSCWTRKNRNSGVKEEKKEQNENSPLDQTKKEG